MFSDGGIETVDKCRLRLEATLFILITLVLALTLYFQITHAQVSEQYFISTTSFGVAGAFDDCVDYCDCDGYSFYPEPYCPPLFEIYDNWTSWTMTSEDFYCNAFNGDGFISLTNFMYSNGNFTAVGTDNMNSGTFAYVQDVPLTSLGGVIDGEGTASSRTITAAERKLAVDSHGSSTGPINWAWACNTFFVFYSFTCYRHALCLPTPQFSQRLRNKAHLGDSGPLVDN